MDRKAPGIFCHDFPGHWDFFVGCLFEIVPPEKHALLLAALANVFERGEIGLQERASLIAQTVMDSNAPAAERLSFAKML